MDEYFVEILGDRTVIQNLNQLPDVVKQILISKTDAWVGKLERQVLDNIAERLNEKSGKLAAGVSSEVVQSNDRIEGRVYIKAPYARAQDRGAVIPPHMIYPVNGKILAFMGATGEKVFATRVSHPGGIIPASRFAKDAYGQMGPEISRGIKNAVVQGIRASMRSGR